MSSVSVEQNVAASPDRAWSLISDVTRMGEWSPESVGCSWVGDATGPTVGAKFKGHNKNGSKSWSTNCTVTEADPGRSFEFRVTSFGAKVATWRYDFEATDHGCVVRETWTDNRGPLVPFFGKIISGVAERESHNRDGMEQTLRNLAEAAERPE